MIKDLFGMCKNHKSYNIRYWMILSGRDALIKRLGPVTETSALVSADTDTGPILYQY